MGADISSRPGEREERGDDKRERCQLLVTWSRKITAAALIPLLNAHIPLKTADGEER